MQMETILRCAPTQVDGDPVELNISTGVTNPTRRPAGGLQKTKPPNTKRTLAMVTTPENLVAGTIELVLFWTFALMPVWLFWSLLQWAGQQLNA
jgi:hypothetical protein